MVCPECDAGARDDARFCLNCGAPLGGDGAEQATRQVPAVAPAPEPASATAPAPPAPTSSPARTPLAEVALAGCPSCSAPNSERRDRCGRCGADLATGALPGGRGPVRRAPAGEPEDTGPLAVRSGRRSSPWVLAVALGVVVGAVVGGMAALGVGPFRTEATQPTPEFDAAVYVGQPRSLPIAQVQASSTHAPQDDNRYEAARTVDGDLSTAWNSDGAIRPDGVGESLRFTLTEPAWVAGFVIANGYQKDDRSFVANARVQRVRVSFAEGEVYDVSVLDQAGRQVVTLPAPVLATQMTIAVLEAYPGDTYDDLAISEVEVRGWTALGRDLDLVVTEG